MQPKRGKAAVRCFISAAASIRRIIVPNKAVMTERGALAIAAITALAWGFTGVFVRLLPGLSSLAITAVRMLVALVSVFPVLVGVAMIILRRRA